MQKTICAISTGSFDSAIGIIRVSGPDAFDIVQKITNAKIESINHFQMKFANIIDGDKTVDEVIIKKFIGPNTFTGENLIEIDCHGGHVVKSSILKLLVKNGAELAGPGEFTQRAYLNGKINLVKAEAIHDLVVANSEIARDIAINSLSGKTTSLINHLRDQMVQIISNIEVNIDYPEYEDVEEITNSKLLPMAQDMEREIKEVLKLAKVAKVAKNGINIAIVGRPNVGKSSLLNALVGEEKAIVTDIQGTTRDTIEAQITINGVAVNLVDTAGIRETDDVVEKIGIQRSLDAAKKADVVLHVVDGSENLNDYDKELFGVLKDYNTITVVNKIDKNENTKTDGVKISAKNGDIKNLVDKLSAMFTFGELKLSETGYLTNERQIGLLERAYVALTSAINDMQNLKPIDLVAEDLRSVWEQLGEILGLEVKENFLDEMFSRFCLGK